jgi:hypothetical protein
VRQHSVVAAGELGAPERGGSARQICRTLVDRIVHGAAEVPDGDDRATLVGRQDEK